MGRLKEMPGQTYKVLSQNKHEATVECKYLCPYCKQVTTAQFTIKSNKFDLLTSAFYEPLKCEHCGKKTNVRYWGSQRI